MIRVDIGILFDGSFTYEVVARQGDGTELARGTSDETAYALDLAIADAVARSLRPNADVVGLAHAQAMLSALRRAAGPLTFNAPS